MFPAQKVSYEAQRERKANLYQTLTGLGSYWKGRKPLILVRAIVLGSLLPPTGNAEQDLAVFEKLMAFDEEGLARRAVVNDGLKPHQIAARIQLSNPWDYFVAKIDGIDASENELAHRSFPLDSQVEGITLRWKREVSLEDKLVIYRMALATFSSYESKAALCRRPEEVDQDWLYAPVWPAVNRHYHHLVSALSEFPSCSGVTLM